MVIKKILKYELLIVFGLLIAVGSLLKLASIYDFSSDWFWFLAGLGLVVEGFISLLKQRQFEKKYKVIEKNKV